MLALADQSHRTASAAKPEGMAESFASGGFAGVGGVALAVLAALLVGVCLMRWRCRREKSLEYNNNSLGTTTAPPSDGSRSIVSVSDFGTKSNIPLKAVRFEQNAAAKDWNDAKTPASDFGLLHDAGRTPKASDTEDDPELGDRSLKDVWGTPTSSRVAFEERPENDEPSARSYSSSPETNENPPSRRPSSAQACRRNDTDAAVVPDCLPDLHAVI